MEIRWDKPCQGSCGLSLRSKSRVFAWAEQHPSRAPRESGTLTPGLMPGASGVLFLQPLCPGKQGASHRLERLRGEGAGRGKGEPSFSSKSHVGPHVCMWRRLLARACPPPVHWDGLSGSHSDKQDEEQRRRGGCAKVWCCEELWCLLVKEEVCVLWGMAKGNRTDEFRDNKHGVGGCEDVVIRKGIAQLDMVGPSSLGGQEVKGWRGWDGGETISMLAGTGPAATQGVVTGRRALPPSGRSEGPAPQEQGWEHRLRSQSPCWRLWGQECSAEGGEEGRKKSITQKEHRRRCRQNHPSALGICA